MQHIMKNILSALILVASAVLVNAHFQISFPPPRGPFVENSETTFCDGFTDVTTNRTLFPLSGGFVTLNSEHPVWSAAFYVATNANPSSFDDFTQVNSFFSETKEGSFCIPLDFSKSNFTSLQNGQNATLQMLYDGGDGSLFQCADITLTNTQSIPSSVQCNQTSNAGNSTSAGNSTTPGSTSGNGTSDGLPSTSLDLHLLGLLSVASLFL